VKTITIQVQNKEHLQHEMEMNKNEKRRGTSRMLTVGGTSAAAASENQMTPYSTEHISEWTERKCVTAYLFP
jgi:hypothetical protein